MNVPNFVPDAIEVSRNVNTMRHGLRLLFVRRVQLLFWFSLVVAASLAKASDMPFTGSEALIAWLVLLAVLSYCRTRYRGRSFDETLSKGSVPLVLVSTAYLGSTLYSMGLPIQAALVGVTCAVVYAFAAGRDFSFVGQFALSWVISSVILALVATLQQLSAETTRSALILNSIVLLYVVYDSSALLARRRMGEEIAAVIDLYRDIFNIFGYALRCLRHWRKHRIWALR
jgi:FtsH-binding integral membrane protein